MREKRYLLCLDELSEEGDDGVLHRAVLEKIDGERRRKALDIKVPAARTASMGAGLLLRKILAEYVAEESEVLPPGESVLLPGKQVLSPGESGFLPGKPECFSVSELLAVSGAPVEPVYGYGRDGKPYFEDYPFHFNLSHSGGYVLCAVSDVEIGADIQQMRPVDELRLAERFFHKSECRELELCSEKAQRNRLFFRMWVRKEACGKLDGRGLPQMIGRDVWNPATDGKEPLEWEEYDIPEGYCTAVCRHRYSYQFNFFDSKQGMEI